jgi:NAD(P)-dependent dehydrogenase (short-subunit alcohol dehydrogenase family)
MNLLLRDKVAVVTGGANGIGKATAGLFAEEGARIAIADRDSSALRETVNKLRKVTDDAIGVAVDVSSEIEVSQFVASTMAKFGRIDVLVNCVGISLQGSVVDTPLALWNRVLAVNLTSAFLMCRAVVPIMSANRRGSIINVASIQALVGFDGNAAYATSKAGLIGLTRQVAVEYAGAGIRANVLSPGGVDVRGKVERISRLEPAFADALGPSDRPRDESAPARSALRTAGSPFQIASSALFLASDLSSYVTGHNLVVDGGWTAWLGIPG